MQLTHTLELPAPIGRVFDIFSQLDVLAPCFPGATVWGRDGDVYHGAVKIKFGPFPLVFEGTARVVRIDRVERRLVVKANARDRRGAAAGAATVTATFHPSGPDGTQVRVSTDLDLTGRPAQLGAGAISSVSDRLAEQFIGCLTAKLAGGLSVEGAGTRAESESGRGDAAGAEGTAGAGSSAERGSDPTAAPTQPRRTEYTYTPPSGSESAPHLQVLPDVARTWAPVVGAAVAGLTVVVLLVRWLRRR